MAAIPFKFSSYIICDPTAHSRNSYGVTSWSPGLCEWTDISIPGQDYFFTRNLGYGISPSSCQKWNLEGMTFFTSSDNAQTWVNSLITRFKNSTFGQVEFGQPDLTGTKQTIPNCRIDSFEFTEPLQQIGNGQSNYDWYIKWICEIIKVGR